MPTNFWEIIFRAIIILLVLTKPFGLIRFYLNPGDVAKNSGIYPRGYELFLYRKEAKSLKNQPFWADNPATSVIRLTILPDNYFDLSKDAQRKILLKEMAYKFIIALPFLIVFIIY